MANEKLVLVGAKRFCNRSVLDGAVELGMPFTPKDAKAYNALLSITVEGTEDEDNEYANPMFLPASDEMGIKQYIRGWNLEDAEADATNGVAKVKKAKPRPSPAAATAAPKKAPARRKSPAKKAVAETTEE